MTEFPTLPEIASDYNALSSYIRYVEWCIDRRTLPLKYNEWEEDYEAENLFSIF